MKCERCGFEFPAGRGQEDPLCFCCQKNIPLPLGGEVATKKDPRRAVTVPIMVTTSLAGADPIKAEGKK